MCKRYKQVIVVFIYKYFVVKKFLLPLIVLCAVPVFVKAQTKFDPVAAAKKMFEVERSKIEKAEKVLVNDPVEIVGDLNGDGLKDCLLSYVLTARDGGNAVVGHKTAVYINTGKKMMADGNFPPLKFCYTVDKISGGIIRLKEYTCAPPYNDYTGNVYRYRWLKKTLVKVN